MEKTMKSLSLFISILLISTCYSQEKSLKTNKDYYADVGVGMTFPISYFGMNTGKNNSYGAANNGFCVNGAYGFMVKKYLGFKVALSVNTYPVDNLIDTTFMNTSLPADVVLRTEVGRWTNLSILLGPTVHYSKGRSIFMLSLLGGIMIANRPSVEYDFYKNERLIDTYYLTGGEGLGVCIRPELSHTYMLNEKLGLKTYISYSYGSPALEYKAEYKLMQSGWQKKDYATTQRITNIDIGLCLMIKMK